MCAFEYVNCDLCRLDSTELLYQVAECTERYSESFNLVRCKNCGLVYVNPRPVKEELYKYYPQESYYAYQNVENKTFRTNIRDLLVEWAGGYRIRKDNRFNYISRLIIWVFKLITKNMLIGVVPCKRKGLLLDVGCGNGSF
ncbi:MAG: hypothetical protein IBX72_13015 [Nitrospirae bacterium]|nr:hypothetical protein [Nitrospirota bacterium]